VFTPLAVKTLVISLLPSGSLRSSREASSRPDE
jgi:hypothetical protein